MDAPSTRRRFQFSLRTLFIGVTLLAILSAAATWIVQDHQRLVRERDDALQQRAVLDIELQRATRMIKSLLQQLESRDGDRAPTSQNLPRGAAIR